MSWLSKLVKGAEKVAKKSGVGKIAKKIGLPTTLKEAVPWIIAGGAIPGIGGALGLDKLLGKAGLDKLLKKNPKLKGIVEKLFDFSSMIPGAKGGSTTDWGTIAESLQKGDWTAILPFLQPPRMDWTPLLGLMGLSFVAQQPYLKKQEEALGGMIEGARTYQNLANMLMPQAQQVMQAQNQLLNLLARRLPRL